MSMENCNPAGALRMRIKKGVSLAVRDVKTSDPYVVVKMGNQVSSCMHASNFTIFSLFFIIIMHASNFTLWSSHILILKYPDFKWYIPGCLVLRLILRLHSQSLVIVHPSLFMGMHCYIFLSIIWGMFYTHTGEPYDRYTMGCITNISVDVKSITHIIDWYGTCCITIFRQLYGLWNDAIRYHVYVHLLWCNYNRTF